jgi:hypothetical protein
MIYRVLHLAAILSKFLIGKMVLIYLQEVVQIVANTSFIMWNIINIISIAETCPNGLVNEKNIWCLQNE